MPFDLSAYLNRIGLETCTADLKGLRTLQAAQIAALPFENVLPFLGQVPDLGRDSLWRKLVVEKCGGYCFELNSLLEDALTALGFSHRRVLARVRMGAAEGGARTHLAFVVTLEGEEWLVDAGFGGQAPVEPVRISTGSDQQIRDQVFRIRFEDGPGEHVLERRSETGWFPLFGFDRVEVRQADIHAANYLCATSPDQAFAASMKVYRQSPDGWTSFLDGRARFVRQGGTEERQLVSAQELARFMRQDMGLGYGDDVIDAISARLRSLGKIAEPR